MAPGLLVTEHLMQHLHADGVRTFDFAMGDYAYKRRFNAERLPLVTVENALTARAMPGQPRVTCIGARSRTTDAPNAGMVARPPACAARQRLITSPSWLCASRRSRDAFHRFRVLPGIREPRIVSSIT